jgi:hypothetical protein
MPAVMGRLDEQPADVAVAGLRDAATIRLAAAAVLTGRDPYEARQVGRGFEAREVEQLGLDPHGGNRVDAAEAAQPAYGLAIQRLSCHLFQLGVEVLAPLLELFDGAQVLVEHGLVDRVIEA